MKKIVSLLCAVVLLFTLFPFVSAAEGIESFEVSPYGGERSASDTVKMFTDTDGTNYLFLPAGTDLSALTVWYSAPGVLSVNGKEIVSGEATDVFSAPGSYTLTDGVREYGLYVLVSSDIPAMFLTTKSGSLDYIHAGKENKESGTIKIVENGTVTLESDLKQIKGRGNSTWSLPKKPYNIKFDKKTDLFGMGKAKKWSLLASYYDKSLIKNTVAYGLADEFGLDFSSKMRHVDLYCNGEYLGNYTVTESVEVGSTRVDIGDLASDTEDANPGEDIEAFPLNSTGFGAGTRKWTDIPNDPEDISGGYLLEADFASRYVAEVSGFQSDRGQCVTVNAPEYATKAQVNYIADLYQQAEDALFSETGFNADGVYYTDYFDLASFAKMYIVSEFCKNVDSGLSSFYMYKEKGDDKFYASPVWDFDLSLGSSVKREGFQSASPEGWFANMFTYDVMEGNGYIQYGVETVLCALYKYHCDFRAEVREQWKEFEKLLNDEKYAGIDSYHDSLAASAVMNHTRWHIHQTAVTPEDNVKKYENDVLAVKNFMHSRTEALAFAFSENSAAVYYDLNGGKGRVVDSEVYEKDALAAVPEPDETVVPPEGKPYFVGWNTEKDGSGTTYYPDRFAALSSEVTVLYAMWSEEEIPIPCGCICHSEHPVAKMMWKIILVFYRVLGIRHECVCGAAHF